MGITPWLMATATPITTATSIITGRHMGCSRDSCATSFITGSVGGSLMAAYSLVITARCFKGRFLWLFSLDFFLLAAWDAGSTPAGYAPHCWTKGVLTPYFRLISFLPKCPFLSSIKAHNKKARQSLIIVMIAWLTSIVGIKQGIMRKLFLFIFFSSFVAGAGPPCRYHLKYICKPAS